MMTVLIDKPTYYSWKKSIKRQIYRMATHARTWQNLCRMTYNWRWCVVLMCVKLLSTKFMVIVSDNNLHPKSKGWERKNESSISSQYISTSYIHIVCSLIVHAHRIMHSRTRSTRRICKMMMRGKQVGKQWREPPLENVHLCTKHHYHKDFRLIYSMWICFHCQPMLLHGASHSTL